MNQKVMLVDVSSEDFIKTLRMCIDDALQEWAKEWNQDNSTKKIMTVGDAAEFIGLAKQTVYTLASHRKIPHYKRGKRLYFRREELEKWINEGKKSTQEEVLKTWR